MNLDLISTNQGMKQAIWISFPGSMKTRKKANNKLKQMYFSLPLPKTSISDLISQLSSSLTSISKWTPQLNPMKKNRRQKN